MKKIGLIVNPIAGMGGAVGLKGTDGTIFKKAEEMGADPVTPNRIKNFLSHINRNFNIHFYVAPGKMGENYVKPFHFKYSLIGEISKQTTASDTKRIAQKMKDENIELLVFCGGDGTARDIYDAIKLSIPVIAIPSGVKMFSAVFAVSPKAAAGVLESFFYGTEYVEKEVLDIDEEAYRDDKMQSKLYGYLKVPKVQSLIQAGKHSSKTEKSISEMKKEIAQFCIENMVEDCIYLLAPGTTVKTISKELNLSYVLLGIDAVCNKKLIKTDLNEEGILKLFEKYKKFKAIISPIGGQGFILGRGNKQFTPEVIKKIGAKNFIIISTEIKLKELDSLRVDTGDSDLDKEFHGYMKVITGYNKKELVEVK
ncbi:MAG: ATP-NAD kinase [Promethearchaeota archaeon]|nr:MAG: ATP-NAD kinase [Candidatus Lokiarchaeota archaeon]